MSSFPADLSPRRGLLFRFRYTSPHSRPWRSPLGFCRCSRSRNVYMVARPCAGENAYGDAFNELRDALGLSNVSRLEVLHATAEAIKQLKQLVLLKSISADDAEGHA